MTEPPDWAARKQAAWEEATRMIAQLEARPLPPPSRLRNALASAWEVVSIVGVVSLVLGGLITFVAVGLGAVVFVVRAAWVLAGALVG